MKKDGTQQSVRTGRCFIPGFCGPCLSLASRDKLISYLAAHAVTSELPPIFWCSGIIYRSSPVLQHRKSQVHLRRQRWPGKVRLRRDSLGSIANPPLSQCCSFQPSTYYDRRYRQSPALIRARRPYLVKNAVLGLALASLSVGICASPRRPVENERPFLGHSVLKPQWLLTWSRCVYS